MGIREIDGEVTGETRLFVLGQLSAHSLYVFNAAISGSTITTQKKL